MPDPIAHMIELLEPVVTFTKLVEGAGSWSIRREEVGRPFYCVVLEGAFGLAMAGAPPITLTAGDFVLIPQATRFQTFSLDRAAGDPRHGEPVRVTPDQFRVGDPRRPPDMRKLIGYGAFGSDDAALIASFLPPLVHVRGNERLTMIVRLIDAEARAARPARAEMLTRLLELLLIDALRISDGPEAPPGLLRALADERLAGPLRAMHAAPAEPWSVATLAHEAGLSRSAFFERFKRATGMAPMRYVLHWRMFLAKRLLRRETVSEVARRVGYGSVSTFSIAFAKYTGRSPTAYLRSKEVAMAHDADEEQPGLVRGSAMGERY